VLAFIFLYVSIISTENGANDKGDVVLIAIAIYGSSFMLLKTIFAVYSHFKWMCCIKCCKRDYDDGGRMDRINKYWKN
jgi:hypothetical protein